MTLPALSAIYARYETISRIGRDRFSGSLAGKLLLRSGLGARGITALVAASIAGAASLCVDADAEALREALRAGLCDFVVGPLEEALRILKNELRRGRPVSVGLTADPAGSITKMIDRGLQPDLVSLRPNQAWTFLERGALALPERDTPDPDSALIEWTLTADAVRSMPLIARVAAQILDPERSDTGSRQRWLERAPRHLGRGYASRQCVRMTPGESASFLAAARAQFPALSLTADAREL